MIFGPESHLSRSFECAYPLKGSKGIKGDKKGSVSATSNVKQQNPKQIPKPKFQLPSRQGKWQGI